MERADRTTRAAFWLAAALFGVALPWPDPEPGGCADPREAEARDGQTLRVRCDGRGPPLRGPARLLFGGRLDPNRASAETLTVLPGIGPARAAAIVAERERRPFAAVEELARVHGIGPVTLARIAPWLEIPDAPPGARLQQNR
ncbi:MAG: ComEA family DNA-binding protein [Myxococcota bacterium]